MSLQPVTFLLTGKFPSRLCPDITAQLVCGQRVKYRPALGRVGGCSRFMFLISGCRNYFHV